MYEQKNYVQALHHANLAVAKLKQLQEDRPLDANMIDAVLGLTYEILKSADQYQKALVCAKEEWHSLLMNVRDNSNVQEMVLNSPVALIESSIYNNEFEYAERVARALWKTIITELHHISEDQRQKYISRGAYWLAQAAYYLAVNDGIEPEEKELVGEEVISLARRALEIDTQLFGIESDKVASDMALLARVLKYFNGIVDDEILRMYEQRRQVAVTARRRKGSTSTGDDGMK